MQTDARQRSIYLPSALLVTLEAALFLGAPLLAAALHFRTLQFAGIETSQAFLPIVAVYAATSLVSMFALGLYTSRRSSFPGLVLRVGLAMALTAFASTQVYELTPMLATGGAIVASATAIAFTISAAVRIAFDCEHELQTELRIVLVLGAGRRAAEIARLRRRSDRRQFLVLGYVVTAGDDVKAIAGELRLTVSEKLRAYCQRHGVDEIVVAMDDHRYSFPLAEVNECRDAGIVITGLGAFLERETGGIRLDALDQSSPAESKPAREEGAPGAHSVPMTQPLL